MRSCARVPRVCWASSYSTRVLSLLRCACSTRFETHVQSLFEAWCEAAGREGSAATCRSALLSAIPSPPPVVEGDEEEVKEADSGSPATNGNGRELANYREAAHGPPQYPDNLHDGIAVGARPRRCGECAIRLLGRACLSSQRLQGFALAMSECRPAAASDAASLADFCRSKMSM